MLYKKTSKLFYKKWPFKVECYIKGAYRLKHFGGVDAAIDWCKNSAEEYKSHWNRDTIDKPALLKFANAVKPYLVQDVQTRVEGGHLNIFCKDEELLDSIVRDLSQWITAVYEPTGDEVYNYLLASTGNKVVCDVYPHGRFKYKIILRDNMTPNSKANFLQWAKKFPAQIRVANTSEFWLAGKRHWMQEPFIYVYDQGTLTMALLFLGNDCKKVHEYILKSSINTPCPH